MQILGWIIWFLTCGCALFTIIAFLYEVFWRVPSGYGPQSVYPLFLRRLIVGFYAFGLLCAAAVTVLTDISKLHLLWFVPAWHFFGIPRWIEWIYLAYRPELIDLIYPESNIPWWFSLCCPFSPSLVPDILRKTHKSRGKVLSAKVGGRFATESVNPTMEIPSEAVEVLYRLHESRVRDLQEHGFSYEQAFWIDFAEVALMPWDDAGEIEIRLSEIFRMYLTIYCEKINANMKVEDESAFLEGLAEKYDLVNEIVSRGGDPLKLTFRLGRAVLGEKDINPWLLMKAATLIIFVANGGFDSSRSIGIKLVKDV
jgi:hypothetical protein